MYNYLRTVAVLLLTTLSLGSKAQTISAADQKGIDECFQNFMMVFEKFDGSNLPSLLTENAEHIIPNGTIIRGREAVTASINGYLAFLKTQPRPDHVTEKILNSNSRYLSKDLIISSYQTEKTLDFGGNMRVDKLTTVVVLRKVKDKWLAEMIALTPVVDMPKQ